MNRRGLLTLLLLTACGGDDPSPRACDRLGLLCADRFTTRSLDLVTTRNVSGDLDEDGTLDLVSAGLSAGLSIAWREPDHREYRLFSGLVPDAKIADIDGDGHLDIAFLTDMPAALHILTGTGTRTLEDGAMHPLAGTPRALWLGHLDAEHVQLDMGPHAWSQLHAADLDSDTILDLVGLQGGKLVTRMSGPQPVDPP